MPATPLRIFADSARARSWNRPLASAEGASITRIELGSASPDAPGGLRSLGHPIWLLTSLPCWLAPRQFALPHAHEAFDPNGQLSTDAARTQAKTVVDQVLWARRQFHKP